MSWLDCHAYRTFIRFHLIYGSTLYINPKSEMEKDAQGNTPYSSQQQCKANGFRSVQQSDVTTQFKASVAAWKEEVKLLK